MVVMVEVGWSYLPFNHAMNIRQCKKFSLLI